MIPLAEAPVGVRPDDYDLPLFIHVLGALTLVGALVLAVSYLVRARRDGSLEPVNASFRSLLYAALPAYVVMRAGAEWIADKEGVNGDDADLSWVDIGYMTADVGLVLIVLSSAAAWLGLRRVRTGQRSPGAGVTIATVLVGVLIGAYAVTIWAMTTKPT